MLFSESAPKIYGLSRNLKHFFLGLIFRNADFLFIIKKILFPHTRQYKKEKGQWNMLFLKEGKRILKHATQKDTNLTNFKMLQNNLNLEYVENNIIVQKTHQNAKYDFF